LLEDKSRYLILFGGADSGKSHFVAQYIIKRMIKETGHRVLLVRKVHRTIRHSQFQILKDVIINAGLHNIFGLVPSTVSINCPNGNEIISAGMDDPDKLKSIHGITIVWIEEATELNEFDFEEIDRRVRGLKSVDMQIIMSFNPISDSHWIYHTFFIGIPDKQHFITNTNYRANPVTICQSNYEDNKYVNEQSKNIYKSYTGNTAQIYSRGLWGGKTDPDQIISHEMIQKAFIIEPQEGEQKLGVDVARYGDDKTVFTVLNGNYIEKILSYGQLDTMRCADIARNLAIEYIVAADRVAVDGVGLGAGVVDRLRLYGMNIKEIIGGSSPVKGAFTDRSMHHSGYTNLRAQMYFYARKMFVDEMISFPEKTQEIRYLVGDLTTARYITRSDKKVQVESKDDIKKRIGRSPDYSDSYLMALFSDKINEVKQQVKVKFL